MIARWGQIILNSGFGPFFLHFFRRGLPWCSRFGDYWRQKSSGVAFRVRYDGFWGALRNDCAALIAALGTEINNPVTGFNDVEVVFYHD